jgi:hypothetical protein
VFDNLATLPSCYNHNGKRSQDDEYAATSITIISWKCDTKFPEHQRKCIRALKRNELSLYQKIFANSQNISGFQLKDSLYIPCEVSLLKLDRKRIDNVIESIARAIYHYESSDKKIWRGKCRVEQNLQNINVIEKAFIFGEKSGEVVFKKKGNYPEIFFYQILKDDRDSSYTIRMVFYESTTFIVYLELI